MPPKRAAATSPYFKATPRRQSQRVSSTSLSKKRQLTPSESDFEGSNSSDSDFGEAPPAASANKRVKTAGKIKTSFNDDSSDDESKAPKTIVIPLPKAREEGDVPYEDKRIHENTMLFLKDLKAHNDREWLRCKFMKLGIILFMQTLNSLIQSMMRTFETRRKILHHLLRNSHL